MKTNQTSTSKMKSAMAGLTLIMTTALFVTSCQKEELQQPASDSNTTAASRLVDQVQPMPALAFSSIKIDHIAGRSLDADYSVIVNSNGKATYEGRRNVYTKGEVPFLVSEDALSEINSICKNTNFFDLKNGYTDIMDMPTIATTYSMNAKLFKTLNEYNGDPAALSAFRSKIENALDLSKLILGDKRFQTAVSEK